MIRLIPPALMHRHLCYCKSLRQDVVLLPGLYSFFPSCSAPVSRSQFPNIGYQISDRIFTDRSFGKDRKMCAFISWAARRSRGSSPPASCCACFGRAHRDCRQRRSESVWVCGRKNIGRASRIAIGEMGLVEESSSRGGVLTPSRERSTRRWPCRSDR